MDLDVLFSATTNENKVLKVNKTQKKFLQAKARSRKSYLKKKANNPEELKRQQDSGNRTTQIKRLENEEYREARNQQGRIDCGGLRTASKKLAVDSGTRGKHLSKDGRALVKHHYLAWKKTHSRMKGFYPHLCSKNYKCLKGYDEHRLAKLCDSHRFSSLKVDDDSGDEEGEDDTESEDEQMDDAESETSEQMDDAKGETSETILESGMIEDQVMSALPPLPSAAVTPHSNGYAHILVVEV